MNLDWAWINRNASLILSLLGQHIVLSVVPVLIAFVVSLPLGYLVFKTGKAANVLLALTGIIYAIPSLALFVAMPLILGTKILNPINVAAALAVYSIALLVRSVVDGLRSVPAAQREGAYALGATRFEAIRAALFYARTGIVGGAMLGFGRALGETMAVTMVIGNNPKVSLSLFAPQYTMAAVIANEFTEAADDLYLAALIEIGLVLFVITLIVNSLSRLLIWSMARTASVAAEPETAPAAA